MEATSVDHTRSGGDTLRLFNRFELKYVASIATARALRGRVAKRLDSDRHGVEGQYQVWSCYYDSADLMSYWEKVEGLRFRRKLRIRHYGDPGLIADDGPVFVEVKQRVNRVTQKRRLVLPYDAAQRLCLGDEVALRHAGDAALADEVRRLSLDRRLKPVSVVGYVREAFAGTAEDAGLRITFDQRVRGRDRDLDLRAPAENRFIVAPALAIVEVKANERVPYWLTEEIARHNLQPVRLSKYCQSIEAFGKAPRSAFHVREDEGAA